MRPRWSQNFLVNPGVAEKIVGAAQVSKEDAVLEIGPGKGVLTALLLEKSASVTAVEIDPELAAALTEKWGPLGNFKLIQSDFLDVDLKMLAQKSPVKIVGNLPYAVTSPILQKAFAWDGWSSAIFMVQKEVGDRIRAKAGTKDYSVLSVSIQARCRVEKVMDVSKGSFRPIPKVDSTVLKFSPLPKPAFAAQEEEAFFKTVKGAFAHRRKTILNSLVRELKLPSQTVQAALESAGLSPSARAETVSVENFARLSRILYNR